MATTPLGRITKERGKVAKPVDLTAIGVREAGLLTKEEKAMARTGDQTPERHRRQERM